MKATVFRDKFARAYPKGDPGQATYAEFDEVLQRVCPFDGHLSPYYSDLDEAYRLSKAALDGKTTVFMSAPLFDVDAPNHKFDPQWWIPQRKILERLVAEGSIIAHTTRGGYRIFGRMETPFEIRDVNDAKRWSAQYLAWCDYLQKLGIVADRDCNDWTRLFRAPYVVRDGKPTKPEWVGNPSEFSKLAPWDPPTVTITPSENTPKPAKTQSEPTAKPIDGIRYPQGNRDKGMFADACKMVEQDMSEGDITAVLTHRRNHETENPETFYDSDIAKIVRSALRTAENYHNESSKRLAEGMLAELGVVRGAPANLNVIPGSFEEMLAFAKSDVEEMLGKREQFGVEPLFESSDLFCAREFSKTPWLVQGLITKGGVATIAAEPKCGKTWVTSDVAYGVASGTKVCGEFETGEPAKVAYFYSEDDGPSVRNRILALSSSRGLRQPPANLYLVPKGRNLDITRIDDLALVIASCRYVGGVELLVLDPLRNIHTGEEDKSDAMILVMRNLRTISTILDCTVLFVHHTAKSSTDTGKRSPGQRMRGSGAIHGAVDSGIYLSGLKGNGQTEFTNWVQSEVKGARSGGGFSLTLNIVDDSTGAATDARWSVTRETPTPEMDKKTPDAFAEEHVYEVVKVLASFGAVGQVVTAKDIRRKLGGALAKVEKALMEAEHRGLVEKNLVGKKRTHRGWRITQAGTRWLYDRDDEQVVTS